MEWEKWLDLFQVAYYSEVFNFHQISITEMTREVTEQQLRVHSLMGDSDEDPANKKVVSTMYLSLGEAARKQFTDKFPHAILWALEASELIQICNYCCLKKKNRTLDRHQFFARMQQPGETLYQIWHELSGLTATCIFGEFTLTLVLNKFIIQMTKKNVQEKLCNEPKDPEQALEYAFAFEEGTKRPKFYEMQNAELSKSTVKSEPVFAVEKSNTRECFRCGESNFTMDHIKNCNESNYKRK